jgi:myosin heavy subunit
LKYSGVLEVVRIRREGYPVRVAFNEFFEDFEMLFIFACGARNTEACAALAQIPHNFARRGCAQGCDAALAKLCCEVIMSFGLQEQGAYQVGASLIFLRDGGLTTLQAITRRLIGERAVVIQALVRSKLGKSRYKRTQQSCLLLQSRLR